jgi:hypothetical protein
MDPQRLPDPANVLAGRVDYSKLLRGKIYPPKYVPKVMESCKVLRSRSVAAEAKKEVQHDAATSVSMAGAQIDASETFVQVVPFDSPDARSKIF